MKIFFITLIVLFTLNTFAGGFAVDVNSMVTTTATTTSTLAIAADPYRNYLLIQNLGSVNVIAKFGSASTAGEGIVIPGGGSYEPIKGIRDSVYIMSASSTAATTILSGR